ncbi:Hypothetical predicted protein [Octopus vulgaris]|uniref:Uncharacterized protein n=1 Tax=Octopus vulgaris TaxID=6645 RepID=A0AA36FM93_OCTVU|nr:Hypothetical predicted protein [Octopus vulgaris]
MISWCFLRATSTEASQGGAGIGHVRMVLFTCHRHRSLSRRHWQRPQSVGAFYVPPAPKPVKAVLASAMFGWCFLRATGTEACQGGTGSDHNRLVFFTCHQHRSQSRRCWHRPCSDGAFYVPPAQKPVKAALAATTIGWCFLRATSTEASQGGAGIGHVRMVLFTCHRHRSLSRRHWQRPQSVGAFYVPPAPKPVKAVLASAMFGWCFLHATSTGITSFKML